METIIIATATIIASVTLTIPFRCYFLLLDLIGVTVALRTYYHLAALNVERWMPSHEIECWVVVWVLELTFNRSLCLPIVFFPFSCSIVTISNLSCSSAQFRCHFAINLPNHMYTHGHSDLSTENSELDLISRSEHATRERSHDSADVFVRQNWGVSADSQSTWSLLFVDAIILGSC